MNFQYQSLDITKKVCTCTFITIFIVIIFILSPLSNFFKTSLFMKLISLIILAYTIYLNIFQVNIFKNASQMNNNPQLSSQLNINIICSYIFTVFLCVLFIFILKNIFFN